MSDLLKNPYSTVDMEKKELHAKVSTEDVQYLMSLYPKRGLLDSVLGTLFWNFMRKVRKEIKLPANSLEFPLKEAELHQLLVREANT